MAAKKFVGKAQPGLRDFTAALATAARETPSPILAHGDCEYLRAEALTILRDAWLEKHPRGDVCLLRGTGDVRPATLADVVAEMSGVSLFASDKLILVRQAERLLFPAGGKAAGDESESSGKREKGFLRILDQPPSRIWLVMESAQLPKNRTLGKRLAADCFLIPCGQPTQWELPEWLRSGAARLGKDIDDAAVDLLQRAHGADLGVLARELDKLALFAGDGKSIDAAMVGEFLTGSIEFDIFGFTNAIESRDADKALFYARRIALQGARDQRGKKEDGERSAHRVLAMLAGSVQNLLRAGVARSQGMDAAAFAAQEKLSPWRAGKLLDAAARFRLRELRIMVGMAADQLRRVHDTGGDVLLALETLAVKFTGDGLL